MSSAHLLNKAGMMEFTDLDSAANEICAGAASWSVNGSSTSRDEYVPVRKNCHLLIIQDKNVA